MAIYFCINDVLDHLEKDTSENPLDSLITVSDKKPACNGFPEDVFTLRSSPRILWLDLDNAAHDLALLLNEVPLYHINVELALDSALIARNHDEVIKRALSRAFGKESPPRTPHTPISDHRTQDTGSLRHPALAHMSLDRLAAIYIRFLNKLGRVHKDYNFEKDILGPRPHRFTEFFDGFMQNGQGKVKAAILTGFSSRVDHDPGKGLDSYLEEGTAKARGMNIDNIREMIWAWLEADHYQMRRCRDIHRMKTLGILSRTPAWVRNDIMALIKKEAMKQFFAESLKKADPDLKILAAAPLIQNTVLANASGTVDPLLQQLLSQTLNTETSYSGAAGQFADKAFQRHKQAHNARLD